MLRDTARPRPWVALLLGPPRCLPARGNYVPSSKATTHRCSHLCVCRAGEGMSCKLWIPGAPIRGQDESPGTGMLSSTVAEGDNPVVPEPLAYPFRKGSQAGPGAGGGLRATGSPPPPPDAVQGVVFGIPGKLRHSQAFSKSITNHLHSNGHSTHPAGSCPWFSLLPHGSGGAMEATHRKRPGPAGPTPHPVIPPPLHPRRQGLCPSTASSPLPWLHWKQS